MKKQYMIGEKNGQKFVAHGQMGILDGAVEISKAEYRRHRAAGVPSWGEELTAKNKALHRNPKRAHRWELRAAKARMDAEKMERERMRNWRQRQIIAKEKRAQATA